MKPIVEKLTVDPEHSFVLQKDVYPYYPTPWHYHPELELVLVVKSTGKRIVGDCVERFSDGDLVFMGPNLPHVYDNDPPYYEDNSGLTAEAIVIHFREDFLGRDWWQTPETQALKELFGKAKRGMKLTGQTAERMAKKMHALLETDGLTRLVGLLNILDTISQTTDYELLASPGFMQTFHPVAGSERIIRVCEYIMNHFMEDITLQQVSDIACMTPNAFCHFFKSSTRKTFIEFLNEIRIGYACKLIAEDTYNISEICYASGFQNVSHFNRQFKKMKLQTPLAYRKLVSAG